MKKAPAALDVETLWQISRIGGVALSPDGAQAVCSVSSYSMQRNQGSTALWLLPTSAAMPRRLTRCGSKDGQAAWSPRGDCIAFVGQREQEGSKDDTPQLYLISAHGAEARRAGRFAPGVESFKWLPDGRRIVFAAWVWPDARGAQAQTRRYKTWAERQETGYATAEAFYRHWDRNLPQGRVLHLLLLDLASGRISDLFEGTAYELPRDAEGNAAYDVHPDGRHIAFAHDPARQPCLGGPLALTELALTGRRFRRLAADPHWDFSNPRYSPDGSQLAATAANVGRVHTALQQLALVPRAGRRWQVLGAGWDHEVDAPLRWSADGAALFFTAAQRGRVHLWRLDLASSRFDVAHAGGSVLGFDLAGDCCVVVADSAGYPARVFARRAGGPAQRLEHFNNALLRRVTLGEVREVHFSGALGDEIQMWLTLPPGFDARRKYAVTHVIHGGPYAAAGDSFAYRWNAYVLAGTGHVIAQVNYHGSSGFGHAFKHSLIGRQGELELQDIQAATGWLLRQRWADRRRVYATGGSYGGFLVAWMNGHVPAWPAGPYRAYVCHAGVFDRVATFSADSYPVRPKDLAATYWQDMPRVLAQSPHAFAGQMHTPTLVIHGARDYRVPDCNGLAYYNTLKARGVAARLLWFADENHWVLKPRNSRQWYQTFAEWLREHGG